MRVITPDGIIHTLAGHARDSSTDPFPTPILRTGVTANANAVSLCGAPMGIRARLASAGGGCYVVLSGRGTTNPVVTGHCLALIR